MKQLSHRAKKNISALIITVSVFLVVSLSSVLGIFDYLEYKTYDFRVRLLAGLTRPSVDIEVIVLDQTSIDWAARERGWSWPWPRKAYAELLDYMNIAGAASVSFDVIFSEPSVYGAEDDAAFVKAADGFGHVVQTVFFSSQWGAQVTWPEALDSPRFELHGSGINLSGFQVAGGNGGRTGAQFPIDGLRYSAGGIGNVTGLADSDGIFRRAPLFVYFDGKAVPGLSAAALMAAGADTGIRFDTKKQLIEWGDYTIPVDKNGMSLLRFRGSIDQYTYIPRSIAEVLQSADAYSKGQEPSLYPEDFTGKHIFFGYYAPGLFDICATPISSTYPGMGMHITMLDNILQQDFIREPPDWIGLLISLVVIVLIVLLVLSGRISAAVSGGILIIGIIIASAFGAYIAGYWIHIVEPLAAAVLVFLAATLYSYATEGSQRRFIKSAFSQYLSPAVIEQIIADPSQLKLGGEKREMTAIFTDIRSFSTISEALGDPAKLVELLNYYLTRMSNIILENQGTIDKYEGDAIIAFFGAPVHLPNHAGLACRSAILMKRAEAEINREALAQGLITPTVMEAMVHKRILKSADDPNPIYTRLGINTGDMVVGNMGTPNKMDYTIMGNAVNLAARLEGVNKQYNTGGILISEYTREKIKDEFITRGLSRARVVGVNTPLRLYELLDIRDEAAPELLAMIETWDHGFAAYENREFPEALNRFKTIYQNNEQDRVAKLYLDRCERYIAAPPTDAQWDNGVDNLTEK
ncbi:adenylate/guanylate cyclase domain-containing protein [Spirochaetia bacterium]|nr:adenylate/guanylate cyclase domain-containing protein [Spirochaetia bacterium]